MGPSPVRPTLGLDIGGTKLAVGVVDGSGRVYGLQIRPTEASAGPDAVLERLFAMGHRAVDAAGLGPVAAVGISCGGPLDAARGVVLSPPHLTGWFDVAVVERARQAFAAPAVLENDGTAAALAEYRHGAGRGTSSIVYLTLSTGIGGGAVLGGRVYRGAWGNGTEFGHILVRSDGRSCSCGRLGCIEAYASGTSIAARALEALEGNPRSSMRGLDPVGADDVVAAVRAGDQVAVEVWQETVALLGSALTDLVNVFGPDLVVLGGGVTRSGSLLLDPVRRLVAEHAMAPAATTVRIEFAELGGVVGVVGAGAAAADAVARPQLSRLVRSPSRSSRNEDRADA